MNPGRTARRGARATSFAIALTLLPAAPLPAAEEPPGGRRLYDRCTGCHQLDRHAMGPLHCGIVGRPAASVDGFRYSEALREADLVWTPEALDAFLADPEDNVPGTKMLYAGIPDAAERQTLIAWLAWAAEHDTRCRPRGE